MKKILIGLMLGLVLLGIEGCSTEDYNPEEFRATNYQKNVDNAVDAPDVLNDLDSSKTSEVTLDANDLSKLVQADLFYNQANYINAYPLYRSLALKYKEPKIIYKAIVCLDHFDVAPIQEQELNQLTDLLIKIEPDSKLSKLFQIKVAMKNGNLKLAENNLDYLVDNQKDTARSVFLFLSSVFSDTSIKYSGSDLKEFANYAFDKYKNKYPEASLMSLLAYANLADIDDLNKILDYIEIQYPTWKIPLYWSLNILLKKHELPDVIKIAHDRLKSENKVDLVLQNIYVAALIKNNDFKTANSYLKVQLNNRNNNKNNILISLGIVSAKLEHYSQSIAYFKEGIATGGLKGDVLRMSIGTIYDYQNLPESAIAYYKVINNKTLLPLKQTLLLSDYATIKDYKSANDLLNVVASGLKMTPKNAMLFKSAYYASVNDYQAGYKALLPGVKLYSDDKDFLYQYASLNSMLGNTQEAIKLYKKCIKLDPRNAYVYNDLAYTYIDQTTKYKLAGFYMKEALMLAPNDPMVLDTNGWLYYKTGDLQNALVYVKRAYDLSHDPDIARHLVIIYNGLNQPTLAKNVQVLDTKLLNQAVRKIILDKMLKVLMYLEYGSK